VDSTGGIAFSSDIVEIDRMNLITLVGTQPGERAMRPDYGVGTRELLFENNDALLGQTITNDILDAAVRYAPEIEISDVEMSRDANNDGQTNVRVVYRPAPTRLDTSEDSISTTVADGG
jgi:phage baseplate assembly protein W